MRALPHPGNAMGILPYWGESRVPSCCLGVKLQNPTKKSQNVTSSRRSAKHSNVHNSSDHRGVDIGSICSTPWRSVAPLHRRWRKPLRVSKKGVGSNKATISCPKIRENHGKLWIFLAFLKLFEDFHQGSHLKHPTNGIGELISLGLFVLIFAGEKNHPQICSKWILQLQSQRATMSPVSR